MKATTLLYATAADPANYAPLIYAFVILLVAIGAIAGYSRGIKRQLVRTITVAIAFFVAYAVTTYTYYRLNLFLSDKTMQDLNAWLVTFKIIDSSTDVSWMYNLDFNAVREIAAIPISLVLVPVMFVSAFNILNTVMAIIHKLIAALCGFSKRNNNIVTRILGMLLGFIQGAFVSAIILTPITGLAGMSRDAIATMREYAPGESFTEVCEEKYEAYVKTASENPVIRLYSKLGGAFLYEQIVTVSGGGPTTNMTDIVPDATKITSDIARLYGMDIKNLTPENEATVERILEIVKSNSYLKRITSGTASSLSNLYTSGVFSFEIEEPFKSIINSAVEIFHTSSSDNISADLDTIADVYFILSRDGVLMAFDKGSDEMLSVLTTKDESGSTTVSRVVDVIRSNERTSPLVTLITKLSVTVMASQSGIGEDALSTYEEIKTGINNDVLSIDKESYETEEEYVSEISNALDITLKNNSIELEKEIVDTMAQYVADNFSDMEVLTDEEVSDVIIYYYDAYLKYLESKE